MLIANPLGALVGGIGLFLLGMWLMTDRLRLAAGAALPWLPGMLAREHPTITVAMQSGSAADAALDAGQSRGTPRRLGSRGLPNETDLEELHDERLRPGRLTQDHRRESARAFRDALPVRHGMRAQAWQSR